MRSEAIENLISVHWFHLGRHRAMKLLYPVSVSLSIGVGPWLAPCYNGEQIFRVGHMPGRLFTQYFLTEGITNTARWFESGALDEFRRDAAEAYERLESHDRPNEAVTEQELIMPVLELLGWADHLPQQGTARGEDIPDNLLFTDAGAKDRAAAGPPAERYRHAAAVQESKRFDLPLDASGRDPRPRTRKPSGNMLFEMPEEYDESDADLRSWTPHGQILRYLSTAEIESDGKIRWGVLTNGRVWRLYGPHSPQGHRILRGVPRRPARTGERARPPRLLPALPPRLLRPDRRRDDHLPGRRAGRGQALRGAGRPGPVERRVRQGLPGSGEGPVRRVGQRPRGRSPGRPHIPLPAPLHSLRRGQGTPSRKRPDLRQLWPQGPRPPTPSRRGWTTTTSSPTPPPTTTTT